MSRLLSSFHSAGILTFIIVFGVSFCQAAHFEPVHETTYCNSNATVETTSEGPYENPQNNWSTSACNRAESDIHIGDISGAYSQSGINNYLDEFNGSYEDGREATLYVEAYSESYGWAYSSDCVSTDAWANASTVAIGQATGNFYQIVPDNYEQQGDLVTIRIDYSAAVELMDGDPSVSTVKAWIDGGFAGDRLLITRNCRDYDDPQESEILQSFDKVELVEGNSDYVEITVWYQVYIGDVIGIHAGVSSSTEIDGEGSTDCMANLDLIVTIESLDELAPFDPSRADMDGSGIVDFNDLQMFTTAWLWETGAPLTVNSDVLFDNPDDLYRFNQRESGGEASALWEWVGSGGVSSGGCLKVANSTAANTLILADEPIDMTFGDQSYSASMMFKRWDTEYVGIDEAQVGFVATDTQDFYTNGGPYMAVTLSASGTDTLRMDLEYKYNYSSAGYSKSLASGIVLEDGHWYKLTALFDPVSSSTWQVTANLEDLGTDGQTYSGAVVTDATTTYLCGWFYEDDEVYAAMGAERHDFASAGVEYVDNLSVSYCPFDPLIADLSRDEKVNLDDFALFASAWLTTY